MYTELIEKFRDKLCKRCDSSDLCHKKPHKMVKCGVFYLVTEDD